MAGIIAEIFEEMGVAYMMVGSLVSSFYGEQRFTRDIDMVADIKLENVDEFVKHFPIEKFYISKEAVIEAIQRKAMFNIHHHDTGHKIDIFIPGKEIFAKEELKNRKKVDIDGTDIFVAAPEYVILKKLEYYKQGESEKHLRDICSMLRISGETINKEYISEWAEKMGVHEIWKKILQKLKKAEIK